MNEDEVPTRRHRRPTVFEVTVGLCTIGGLFFTVATHYGWL
ncbi:MAG: hypothetical protein ACLGI2_14460 [Acidimicrobiia bacterium]